MTNQATKFFAAIGLLGIAIPSAIGAGLLILIWRVWWLYPAWDWYLVPLGLPRITFWHFAGLTMLVGIYTLHTDYKKDNRPIEWASWVVNVILWPPVAWAILWWLKP